METFKLEGKLRQTTGKVASKADRNGDTVPCVLYGGNSNMNFSVDYNTLKKTLYTDKFVIVDLSVDGSNTGKAIVKEIQFHPVSNKILHVDFQALVSGKKVTTFIPVVLKGFAKGQQAGGKLELKERKIKIKDDADSIPNKIEIDVTNLEMGKSIRVRDINISGVDIVTSPSIPVAIVSVPRAMRGQAAGGDKK